MSNSAKARPRLVHRPWFTRAAGTAAAGYLGFVARTARWKADYHPDTVALFRERRGGIGVFWHQRLLLIPRVWHGLKAAGAAADLEGAAIVSRHGDGELIARTLDRLGVRPIRGSTRRGGAKALAAARRVLDRGGCVAIVVDGPRGPHGHVHGGAAFLAKVTGRQIFPVTFAVDRGLQAGSWDRLLLPAPCCRGTLLAGAPLAVPADADSAALGAAGEVIAQRLRALNVAADAGVGARRHGVELPLRPA